MPAPTVAQTIAAALRRHGVEMIFAQSLPSALVLACEEIGIRQIAYRQENMGGAMADGYARISQKTAIVCAQNGPAATLLVPPLAEALKASIAVIALVQDVESAQIDKNAFQDLDQIALFSPCSKWVRRLPAPDRADDYVDAAFVAAGSGRPGPAVLLLPADLLKEPASGTRRKATLGTWPIDRFRPSDEALEAAAGALASARCPVIYAGGGAVSPGASAALSKLQDDAHLPVFTTNMGKGAVAEGHELSCGVLGALNGRASLGRHTQSIMNDADVVLLAGTRTNQNGTDSWRAIPAMPISSISTSTRWKSAETTRRKGSSAMWQRHWRRLAPRCRNTISRHVRPPVPPLPSAYEPPGGDSRRTACRSPAAMQRPSGRSGSCASFSID